MAVAIEEPTGKVAGRVTIVTTLTSMLPTIFTCAMIVTAFLIGMISAEIAAAMLVTALGLGSAITGTVFGTAKNTPTDQGRPTGASAPAPEAFAAGAAGPAETEPSADDDVPAGTGAHRADVSLADELEQYRPAGGVS